ncbi:MAG: SDR family NAD(P)-dependent oxidoreductase [Proteobacteria bacterium]|nr:SDR family NAD(P)-dependent oxidoreductase [Pseudomonadota bacterium]
MESFADRIAVVTGGGTGMGRELARKLAAAGAHVAMCDVSAENMAETRRLCLIGSPDIRVTTHLCDVSNETQVLGFRDEVMEQHDTGHVNLVFNNAGIGGGGEFVDGDRDEWERTFAVCWYGVYYSSRAFMPLLIASDEGVLVNTSSVNGFWASIGAGVPHTAYSAAKFAVKGFTEALITDLRLNAPHVKCAVVMPGHIGTSIGLNTSQVLGKGSALEMTDDAVADVRKRMLKRGLPVSNVPDEHLRHLMHQRAIDFRDKAPCSAEQAADIILTGVREGRWRILVGDDAQAVDRIVREDPVSAYDDDFVQRLMAIGHFRGLMREE